MRLTQNLSPWQGTTVCGTSTPPSPGWTGTSAPSEETPATSPSSESLQVAPVLTSRWEAQLTKHVTTFSSRKRWQIVSWTIVNYSNCDAICMCSYTDALPPQQRADQQSHLPEWSCPLPLGSQQEPTKDRRGGVSPSDLHGGRHWFLDFQRYKHYIL